MSLKGLPRRPVPAPSRPPRPPRPQVLSALAFWAPVFAECPHVPSMAFPFVSAFGADTLGAFEALATVFTVVTPGWFELFPDPPVSVVCFVESVLQSADPELSAHLDRSLMGAFAASWALLSTFLAEVLFRDDWLALWDHVIAGADSLLPLAAAAFLVYFRAPLLARRRPRSLAH